MLKLGALSLDGSVPRVAVGFRDKASPQLLVRAHLAGLDIAEIRIDQFASYEASYVLREIKKFRDLPTIATIRSIDEGGNWRGSDSEKLSLFRAIISDVDAVDVELKSPICCDVINIAHDAGKLCVVSYHDFHGTQSLHDLSALVDEAKSTGADIVKIATQASRKEDIQALAKLTIDNAGKNIIVIAMGSEGLVTRLLFPALGSLVTFAYAGEPTAPGQLSYESTFELLRTLYPSFNQEKVNSLKLMECV